MQDICDEVVRRLEAGRPRVEITVRYEGNSTSVYDNASFTHEVRLTLASARVGPGFNIMYGGVEYSATPEVLESVSDSVAEEVRAAALANGMRSAHLHTTLVAASGEAEILRTSSGIDMRDAAASFLADLRRAKALAENVVGYYSRAG